MLHHLISHRPSEEWIVVFLEDGPMVQQFERQGIETRIILSGRLRQVHRFAYTVWQIADLVRDRGAVGIVSWLGKAHLYGGMAALLAGVPAIWYQLALPADIHWMDRLASLIPARGILTCSRAGAHQQQTLWPHRSTRVVYPGVDLDRFDPVALPAKDDLRRRFGLPVNAPIVGMVGRLQRWKGMHVFVDAVARLRTVHPNLRGIIVGGPHEHESDYPSFLRQQIERLGLEDTIIMTGFHSDPAAWMKTFDVFVHASDREPFGLVVIEAMAMGLPVVASDTAGPTEIITAGRNGLFAPFGDDAALARQIGRCLSDPEWAAGLGRAARRRAGDFAAPCFADRVASAVSDLVAPDPVAP